MFNQVLFRGVDFTIQEFANTPDLVYEFPKGRLVPVPGIKIALDASRHFMVSKKHKDGKSVFEALEKVGQHCTGREIRAMEAERDSMKMKQLQFLLPRIGEEFDGVIVRMVNFGFFVNLSELFIDGLVPLQSLDDYFVLNADATQMTGKDTGQQFELGQKVRVRITRVDTQEQLVDFECVQN